MPPAPKPIRARAYRCACGLSPCIWTEVFYYRSRVYEAATLRADGWKRRFGQWFAPGHWLSQVDRKKRKQHVCPKCRRGFAPKADKTIRKHRCGPSTAAYPTTYFFGGHR